MRTLYERGCIVLFCLLAVFMAGCVNESIVNSYEAYQNTVGEEYKKYLDTGKRWDGKSFTEAELKARRLNLKAARAVIKEARNADR